MFCFVVKNIPSMLLGFGHVVVFPVMLQTCRMLEVKGIFKSCEEVKDCVSGSAFALGLY